MVYPPSLWISLGRLNLIFTYMNLFASAICSWKFMELLRIWEKSWVSFFLFPLASAFDKKNFKCNAGKTQLLRYYERVILCLNTVQIFKNYLSDSFSGGKSAGWQPKEIDFYLLRIKQLTSYVKAIAEMWCCFVGNVVSK